MATFDAPQSPIEAILQNMLGANNVLQAPQSRNESLLLQILDAMQHGGGEVTPASIVTATGQMTAEQKAATTQNIGAVSSSEFTPTVILLSVDGGAVELDLSGIGLTVQQFLEAYIAGKRFFFVLEKGNGVVSLTPSYLDVTNTRIVLTGYDNGSLYVTDLSAEGAYVMSGSLEALPSTESLQLTATPTAGPSGNTLMSGTWSGATWEEVVAAIQNSRLIQIDVANIGKITLLYNLGSMNNAVSNAFVFNVGGTSYNAFAEAGSNNQFKLSIINARTKTENVTGTTPTITPAANHDYQCGELTSLTISNPPAEGKYSIIFYSGANPTATVGIENFTAEANKRYKITVEDNYATYDSWPYTPQ